MAPNDQHHKFFADKSELYARSRPTYPEPVFEFLAATCKNRILAWDCGCGNGQASVQLSKYFENVEAIDVSSEQIGQAAPHPQVKYSVSPAERTSFPNNSFDFICVAQALHWFDYKQFWPEVTRVLRPSGIFAAFGYS
jgi:ubiquinone/menaquinone biosynthesis C-methylase UbiE